jgi:tRNA 2-thiouridine synthesizing protein A
LPDYRFYDERKGKLREDNMTEKIDARGLSCPQPVVLTQKAIKSGLTDFQVIVDSEVSKENVIRCIENSKLSAEPSADGETYIIRVSKK